jgi:HAD superfamily hydrolase (TIGR01509 family)
MAEIELVIFDCDGVLMDSETIAAKAKFDIYSKYGLNIDAEEFSQRFAGSSSVDILKELEPELDLPVSASVLDEIQVAVDEQCAEQAQMIRDADNVLDLFDQPRCICSNSPQHRLKAMLSRVDLYDRFRPYIFSSKDFEPPRNKPKPDVFLKALEEFEVDAQATVVVEDSVHGIAAGVAAGLRIIGFTGASHTYPGHSDALISAGAETVIRRLKDLPATIEAFRKWENISN